MSLYDTIERDYKSAMRNRDDVRLSVIRLVKTAIKNKEKELVRPLEDAEILAVFSHQAKQRREAIEQFKKGGREDLVQKEGDELLVIEAYLPAQMSREEVERTVEELIGELGAQSMKDMGRVMKTFIGRHSGSVDGKIVSDVVKAILSNR